MKCSASASALSIAALLLCGLTRTGFVQERKGASQRALQTTDVYVSPEGNDRNDGSQKHPWRTLQRASQSAAPGTVVHAAPGTYTGAVVTSASGAPDRPVRYVSDVKWGVKLRAADAKDAWVNRGDWVSIEEFDVSGNGDYGIRQLASFGKIVGNRVHDVPAVGCTSYGGAGIFIGGYDAHDNQVVGNVVHDIGNPDVKCHRVHGIYQANRGGNISNNVVYRNQAWGIHLWHAARDVVISNNLIFENGQGGISVGAGDAPGGVKAEEVTVSNNIIVHNGRSWSEGPAIREYGDTGVNRYLNNLLFDNRGTVALQNGNGASGTIMSDPQLINYRPDGAGDYRPRSGSPAVASGTRIGAPNKDFAGRARAEDSPPDLGPFPARSAGGEIKK